MYIYAKYLLEQQETIDSLLDVSLGAPFNSCTLHRVVSYLHVAVLGRGFRACKNVTILQSVGTQVPRSSNYKATLPLLYRLLFITGPSPSLTLFSCSSAPPLSALPLLRTHKLR